MTGVEQRLIPEEHTFVCISKNLINQIYIKEGGNVENLPAEWCLSKPYDIPLVIRHLVFI